MGRCRFGVVVVAAATVLLVNALAAPAFASTTKIGQTRESTTCPAGYQWIQTATANGTLEVAPAAGVLTSWSTRAGSRGGKMQFEVWRPKAVFTSTSLTLVYISPVTKLRANRLTTVHLSPSVPVDASDVLGYRTVTATNCALRTRSSADDYDVVMSNAAPAVGTTVDFTQQGTELRLDLAASFH